MGLGLDDRHRVHTKYETPDRQYVIFFLSHSFACEWHSIFDMAPNDSWRQLFAKAMIRPFAMFFREPILQLLGIYMAFLYVL